MTRVTTTRGLTSVLTLAALCASVRVERAQAQSVETPPAAQPAEQAPPPVEPPPKAITTAEPPVSEAPPASEAPRSARAAPYALWTLGAASLAAGAVVGVLALKAKSDYDDAPTVDHADKVHNLSIGADVGLGLGAILVLTGTIFYLRRDEVREANALGRLDVAPLVGKSGGGGRLTFHF